MFSSRTGSTPLAAPVSRPRLLAGPTCQTEFYQPADGATVPLLPEFSWQCVNSVS